MTGSARYHTTHLKREGEGGGERREGEERERCKGRCTVVDCDWLEATTRVDIGRSRLLGILQLVLERRLRVLIHADLRKVSSVVETGVA